MNIVKILQAKYPGTEWVLTGEDYDGLDWLDKSAKPTLKDLQKVSEEVDAAEIKAINSGMRLLAYQNNSDPLFFKWQAGLVDKEQWLAARADVDKKLPR
jgi:hypothetical protein